MPISSLSEQYKVIAKYNNKNHDNNAASIKRQDRNTNSFSFNTDHPLFPLIIVLISSKIIYDNLTVSGTETNEKIQRATTINTPEKDKKIWGGSKLLSVERLSKPERIIPSHNIVKYKNEKTKKHKIIKRESMTIDHNKPQHNQKNMFSICLNDQDHMVLYRMPDKYIEMLNNKIKSIKSYYNSSKLSAYDKYAIYGIFYTSKFLEKEAITSLEKIRSTLNRPSSFKSFDECSDEINNKAIKELFYLIQVISVVYFLNDNINKAMEYIRNNHHYGYQIENVISEFFSMEIKKIPTTKLNISQIIKCYTKHAREKNITNLEENPGHLKIDNILNESNGERKYKSMAAIMNELLENKKYFISNDDNFKKYDTLIGSLIKEDVEKADKQKKETLSLMAKLEDTRRSTESFNNGFKKEVGSLVFNNKTSATELFKKMGRLQQEEKKLENMISDSIDNEVKVIQDLYKKVTDYIDENNLNCELMSRKLISNIHPKTEMDFECTNPHISCYYSLLVLDGFLTSK